MNSIIVKEKEQEKTMKRVIVSFIYNMGFNKADGTVQQNVTMNLGITLSVNTPIIYPLQISLLNCKIV